MENIEHQGTVIRASSSNITASIECQSACGNCPSRGGCAILNKTIDIKVNAPHEYKAGDKVIISTSAYNSWLGLFLGYILPLIVVLFCIILGSVMGCNENYVGVASLLILVPYYFLIWLFRKKINSIINFQIRKTE